MSYVDVFLSDVRFVVGVRIVGVHVLDGVEDAVRVEGVVVAPHVVLHHHVEEVPAQVEPRGQRLVLI